MAHAGRIVEEAARSRSANANVEPLQPSDAALLEPVFRARLTDDRRIEHAHAWQFGTLLPSEGSLYSGGMVPRSVLLVCSCGALRRVRVPELER